MTAPIWIDPCELLYKRIKNRPLSRAPELDHCDFNDQALRLAGALHAKGIRNAAVWFNDAVELAIALYACWRANVIAHMPSDLLPQACARLDANVDIWLSDATPPVPATRVHNPALSSAPPLPAALLDESAAGVVLYTSGSSGAPKAITKQWRQLANEVRALAHQWPARESMCVLGSVGPYHMFGLPFRVLWPLCAGHLIDRPQRHYPEELEHASLTHSRFQWVSSPALLRRVEQRIDWTALRGKLAAIYIAGGSLPVTLSEHISLNAGCPLIEIYGSSETGAAATKQGVQDWQLLQDVQAGLNEHGALWIASAWTAGQEQTADAATLTADGFKLLGRMDRIIKLEERRISLPEVEQALEAHPHIAEARVGLVPGRPRLTALIALNTEGLHALRNGGRKALTDGLRRHLNGQIIPLAIPRSWRLFRQLPWNTQGKISQSSFIEAGTQRTHHPIFEPASVCEVGTLALAFDVPLDLPAFSGHFPDTPVVPGVIQIEWAMAQACIHVRSDLHPGAIENLKFQRLMRPGDRATLILRWDEARKKLNFSYQISGEPCSGGRIVCTVDEQPSI